MINNRRIKLKFAQQAKSDSLSIIIFGNQTDKLPTSYEKYLKNYFITKLKLVGVPIKITLSKQKNPFEWMGFHLDNFSYTIIQRFWGW